MMERTLIFVPGKNTKPRPQQHRALLWRALLEGVKRASPAVYQEMGGHENGFHLIPWNYLFYRDYKDITPDLPWFDALLNKHTADAEDIRAATHWKRKFKRLLYTLVDRVPQLSNVMPKPFRRNLEELQRYFINLDGIGSEIRELLKQILRPRLQNGERVLLIGHSMGSVIAYDSLWELSHLENLPGKVDCLLTLGSPLRLNTIRKQLRGQDRQGPERYPDKLRHWSNLASVGDIVATHNGLHKDFGEMLDYGLIENVEDRDRRIYTYFRNEQGFNFHHAYGYLMNPKVGGIIARWWQQA